MASSLNCWKCLSRPSTSYSKLGLNLAPSAAAPFSSTANQLAMPVVIKKARMVQKGNRTLRMKKKPIPKASGKPPMPGERKALRKRIVLSNTNAIEVEGMQDLSREMIDSMMKATAEGTAPEVVGKVVGLPGTMVDSLRASEAFKTTQGWGLFRRPAVLVRKEAMDITEGMVSTAEKKKESYALVIDGAKGTGKSIMLLHAMATAFARGWIVLNIPEAQELATAVNDYAAIPGTTPTLWSQPTYTANWLTQIAKANNTLLSSIELSEGHNLPMPIQPKTTLARLLELGSRDPDVAWPVFQAFWAEITKAGRPPILVTLDGMNWIMGNSQYRDPEFNLIHTHDFTISQHILNHLSGATKLPNGGAIIAATSRSHSPTTLSMNLAITQTLDKQNKKAITPKDPFERRYDERVEKALQNIPVMKLGGLSKPEARGLMEYWAASGVLRQRVDEKAVTEKWTLAGNGVVAEIQRGALRMRM